MLMKHFTTLIAGVLLLLVTLTARAAEPEWSWLWTEPTPSEWWLRSGRADVTSAGKGFTAVLYDGADPSVKRLSIKGEIRGTAVTAVVTIHAADTAPVSFTGHYRAIDTPRSADHERLETISLFDGFGFIGLARTTTKPKKDK
jgi:hypothetical protein